MRQSLGRFPKGKWPFSLHGGRMDERIRQRCASSVCTRLPPRKGSVAFGDKGIAASFGRPVRGGVFLSKDSHFGYLFLE